MRATWGVLTGAATLVVLVAAGLPWRGNDLVDVEGQMSADVLGNLDATVPLLAWVLGVLLGCAATALTVRGARVAALVVAALATVSVVTAVVAVPLGTVRTIGQDARGLTFEPEATDTLATGAWVAIAGAVVLLVTAAAALLATRRR